MLDAKNVHKGAANANSGMGGNKGCSSIKWVVSMRTRPLLVNS